MLILNPRYYVRNCTHDGGLYVARTNFENSLGAGGATVFCRHFSPHRRFVHPADSDTGDTMMMSLYFTLGIFLLIAVRNPFAHRSMIAFAAWSSFAHAVTMSIQGLQMAAQRGGFLAGSGLLVAIGIALIALAPKEKPAERAPVVVT